MWITYLNTHTYVQTYVCMYTTLDHLMAFMCVFNFLGSTEVVQGPVSSEMPSPEVGPVNPPSPQGPSGVLCVTV